MLTQKKKKGFLTFDFYTLFWISHLSCISLKTNTVELPELCLVLSTDSANNLVLKTSTMTLSILAH